MERRLVNVAGVTGDILAVSAVLLVLLSQQFNFIPINAVLPIFLGLMLAYVYLKEKYSLIGRIIFASLSLMAGTYLIVNFSQIVFGRVGTPNQADLVVGSIAVVVLFIATYRKTGPAIVVIALATIFYAFIGPWLPYLFSHQGYSLARVINQLYLTSQGIYGLPLRVVIQYVVLFIFFGNLLRACGAADFMIDLARNLTAHTAGGIGKVAVLSSALVGSISGSAVANVAVTGSVTIPGMKKTGFQPHVAGAVEAVASTAGQLIPPVMGAAAFLMADFLQISYWKVALAAIVPSLFYVIGTYLSVHFYAMAMGLTGEMEAGSQSGTWKLIRTKGYFLAPLVVLVVVLSLGYSAYFSGTMATLTTLAILFLRRGLKKGIVELIYSIRDSGADLASLVPASATAGAIVGMITLTGLGVQLSGILVQLSQGYLLILAILAALCAIVLGMGMPTSAVYIIGAVLLAPALTQLGVLPIVAHLFMLYYGCLSMITPPVAMAAYAGAAIAGANPNQTGWQAVRIGLPVFAIPFIFLYNPTVLVGAVDTGVLLATLGILKAVLAVLGLSIGAIGFFRQALGLGTRVAVLGGSILMISDQLSVWLFGLCLGAGALAFSYLQKAKAIGRVKRKV